jgi:hypothetical protein
LPIRTQTTEGPPCSSWCTAKSSSFVTTTAPDSAALARTRGSGARSKPRSATCSALWPRDSSWRASAGGSWASTRKRNQLVRRTGWSFCLAANSSTAVMSSGSRYG